MTARGRDGAFPVRPSGGYAYGRVRRHMACAYYSVAILFGSTAAACFTSCGGPSSLERAARYTESSTVGQAWFLFAAVAIAIALAALVVWLGVYRRRGSAQAEREASLSNLLPSAWRNRALDKMPQIFQILSGNVDAMFLNRLQVRHLMTELVQTASPETPVEEVANIMAKTRMRHLPICRGHRHLAGIISDRDLHCRKGSTAGEIMTTDAISVQLTTPLVEAIDFMLVGNFSCLPVFQADLLCGIITTADVILAMRCALEVLQEKMQQLLEQPREPEVDSADQGRSVPVTA